MLKMEKETNNRMVIYTSESKRSLNLKNKISDGGYLMNDKKRKPIGQCLGS